MAEGENPPVAFELGDVFALAYEAPDFLIVDGLQIRERRQDAGSSGDLDIKLATYCRTDSGPSKSRKRS